MSLFTDLILHNIFIRNSTLLLALCIPLCNSSDLFSAWHPVCNLNKNQSRTCFDAIASVLLASVLKASEQLDQLNQKFCVILKARAVTAESRHNFQSGSSPMGYRSPLSHSDVVRRSHITSTAGVKTNCCVIHTESRRCGS